MGIKSTRQATKNGGNELNRTMHSHKSKVSGSQKTGASSGRSGFTQNDVIKGKLISSLCGARLEIFGHFSSARKKITVQKNIIEFVRRFVNYKNYKDVIMAVKVEIPKLLGFQKASIMVLDEQ